MTRRAQPAVTVAVVAALAGLMFATSATLAHGTSGLRQPADLVDMVRSESSRVAHLTERVDELRTEVDTLSGAGTDGTKEDAALAKREGMVVGSLPVRGSGVQVTIDDAPASSANIPGATPDGLVVHQQDIQNVVNALWAGGAEAVTLQGQRLIMTSQYRCSGNILSLHGQVFSPPYVVEAIGDPARLRAALDADEALRTYRQYVTAFGLGWSVRTLDDVTMPAYSGSTDLRFASLPEGTDPLR